MLRAVVALFVLSCLTAVTACGPDHVPPSAPSESLRVPKPPDGGDPRGQFPHPVDRDPVEEDPDGVMRSPEIPARLRRSMAAEYPAGAPRIRGTVVLELIVERDGRVWAARVLKPLPFGLDEAALQSVRRWEYEPARHKGRNVRSFVTVSVAMAPPDDAP